MQSSTKSQKRCVCVKRERESRLLERFKYTFMIAKEMILPQRFHVVALVWLCMGLKIFRDDGLGDVQVSREEFSSALLDFLDSASRLFAARLAIPSLQPTTINHSPIQPRCQPPKRKKEKPESSSSNARFTMHASRCTMHKPSRFQQETYSETCGSLEADMSTFIPPLAQSIRTAHGSASMPVAAHLYSNISLGRHLITASLFLHFAGTSFELAIPSILGFLLRPTCHPLPTSHPFLHLISSQSAIV